jgi:hypothetical protein
MIPFQLMPRPCGCGYGDPVVVSMETLWLWLQRPCGCGYGDPVVVAMETLWLWLRRPCGCVYGDPVVVSTETLWLCLRRPCGCVYGDPVVVSMETLWLCVRRPCGCVYGDPVVVSMETLWLWLERLWIYHTGAVRVTLVKKEAWPEMWDHSSKFWPLSVGVFVLNRGLSPGSPDSLWGLNGANLQHNSLLWNPALFHLLCIVCFCCCCCCCFPICNCRLTFCWGDYLIQKSSCFFMSNCCKLLQLLCYWHSANTLKYSCTVRYCSCTYVWYINCHYMYFMVLIQFKIRFELLILK